MPRMVLVMGRVRIRASDDRARVAAISRGPRRGRCVQMRMRLAPDLLLGEVEQPGEHDQKDHHLEADPLALVEMRLGRPHQEGGDVLAVLLDRLRRAVVVGDLAGEQRLRHREVMAGEVLVVERAGRNGDAGGRVLVALQQRRDVVGALLLILREQVEDEAREAARIAARLGEHRHVGRLGRKGADHGLRSATGSDRPRSICTVAASAAACAGRIARAAGIREIAEGDQRQAVTVRADVVIDLEAALELPGIVGAERARERPVQLGRRGGVLRRRPARPAPRRRRRATGRGACASWS